MILGTGDHACCELEFTRACLLSRVADGWLGAATLTFDCHLLHVLMPSNASSSPGLFQLATAGLEGYVYELVSKHLGVSAAHLEADPSTRPFTGFRLPRRDTCSSRALQAFIHLSREQLNVSAWEGEIVFE